MTNTELKELLDKYVRGKCTPEEKSKLDAWYELQVGRSDLKLTDDTKKYLKAKLRNQIDANIKRKSIQSSFKHWFLAAAVFIVIACSFLLYYNIERVRNPVENLDYQITSVPSNKRVTLTLSDGSVITLNSSTKISYPKIFGEKERRVFLLAGEAYFDIKSDPDKPFIVESGELETRVLGTAFNIKNTEYSGEIRVTVNRGKVRVSDNIKAENRTVRSYILLPDNQISFNKATREISQQKVFASTICSWRDGSIVFDNEQLISVIKTLNEKYNTDIRLKDDTIKKYRISGTFKDDEKLKDVLFAISKSSQLLYKEIDNNIILYLDK